MTTWPILLKDVFVICISPIIHLVAPPPPAPPPLKKWLKHCPQFLLGRLKYPGGIKIKGYAKVWRANMYYWRSANGEINSQIMDHAVIRLTI